MTPRQRTASDRIRQRPTTDLTRVKREVLPDALRITIELGQEVTFRSDRLDGPPRVFIDFDNTRPVEAIKDATIPFADDVVRKVRIGRQTETRTRVVMDLSGAGRHSIYTLYNPYRVVIDFARAPGAMAAAVTPATTAPPSAVRQAAVTANNGVPVPTAVPTAAPASATPAAPVPGRRRSRRHQSPPGRLHPRRRRSTGRADFHCRGSSGSGCRAS